MGHSSMDPAFHELALSNQCGSERRVLIADANEPQIESKTRVTVSLFQLIA